jgi:hypothetical protein
MPENQGTTYGRAHETTLYAGKAVIQLASTIILIIIIL